MTLIRLREAYGFEVAAATDNGGQTVFTSGSRTRLAGPKLQMGQ